MAGWAEAGVLFCLAALSGCLPFAEITAVREISLILGVFFWIIRMIILKEWDVIRTPLDLPLGLLALTAIISFFTAIDPLYTLRELHIEMLNCMVIYYLAVNNLRTEARAKVVLCALIAGAAIMDTYGVINYLLSDEKPRLASLHASAPQLWTYLIQTAPFLMIGILWLKGKFIRSLLIVILLLHVASLYFTLGRTVMITLVFEIAIIMYLVGISYKILLIGALAAFLCVAVFLPRQTLVFGEKRPDQLHIGNVAIPGMKGTRMVVWQTAIRHLTDHPFTGLGFGRRSFVKKYPHLLEAEFTLWHTHNTFLSIAVELGLQGLVVFCFLIYRILRHLWPRRPRGPDWLKKGIAGPLAAAVVVMVLGFFLSNMTNDLYVDDTALLFWLLIGFAFSLKLHSRGEAAELKPE